MAKIVVIGSTNTDMVVRSARIPVPGETVTGGTFLLNPGGKGANQAVACARLGGETTFIAKVGDDAFGRATGPRLAKDGIDARLLVDPAAASGVALILVDAEGRNCISVAPGANATLTPSDLEPMRSEIEGAAALVMQLETPIKTVAWAMKVARAAGVTTVLNPAPAAELPADLYANLDWITPNETEAKLLTGVEVTDAASAKDAAAVLHARGVKGVVVTLGAQGAFSTARLRWRSRRDNPWWRQCISRSRPHRSPSRVQARSRPCRTVRKWRRMEPPPQNHDMPNHLTSPNTKEK